MRLTHYLFNRKATADASTRASAGGALAHLYYVCKKNTKNKSLIALQQKSMILLRADKAYASLSYNLAALLA